MEEALTGRKVKLEKPSTITQTLARESFFGANLMSKCTPSGTKLLPALPKAEMMSLKKAAHQFFPQFWHLPKAFESEWKKKSWPAIEQACGRLRRKQ